jgi:hypothetical protein
MALVSPLSPLAIRDIIDKVGVDDSFYFHGALNICLPGARTPETLELEDSIRRLITRFRTVEHRSSVGKQTRQANNVVNGEHGDNFSLCNEVLEVPLTAEGPCRTPGLGGSAAPKGVPIPSGQCSLPGSANC